MAELTVRGAKLHYEDRGEGRPVILLHGVWMSSAFFTAQLTAGIPGCRLIAPDFRGHGASEKPMDGHTVAGYASDLATLIEHLDLQDVVLVGWSMGAFVIWDYVRQFGTDRLAGTVIVDESASDWKCEGWDLGIIDDVFLRDINAGLQMDRAELIEHFVPLMFKEAPSEQNMKWMCEEIARPPASVASAIIVDQTLQDYRPDLPSVTVPSLVCVGADEQLVPVAAGEYLVAHLPDARLVVFDESSHCPFIEEPERFNEVLGEFVAALPTSAAFAGRRA